MSASDDALIASLRHAVADLRSDRERVIFERNQDLNVADAAVAACKAMRNQRNDLIGTLQAIAKNVRLDGDDAWVALCEDPSNVLRLAAEEREACARIADAKALGAERFFDNDATKRTAEFIAAAIRSRGVW